jgi:Transposase DDE domain
MDLTTLFCEIDDFCKIFMTNNTNFKLANDNNSKRNRPHRMSLSEIMTIVIYFQESGYRNFKTYYTQYVVQQLQSFFPDLLSYNRFVAIMPNSAIALAGYLSSRMDNVTGISFIDSTKLEVCNKKRISKNKVFKGVAEIGKTSMGWFFGFKLHLITNHTGGLLAVKITPGNISDVSPVFDMAKDMFGKIFGDKGYISKDLFERLKTNGSILITPIKKNMKNKLLEIKDKILLRKRAIIETINDQLKNIYQVNHTRHRSVINFIVNTAAALIAYTYREKKPSISGVNLTKIIDLENMDNKLLLA